MQRYREISLLNLWCSHFRSALRSTVRKHGTWVTFGLVANGDYKLQIERINHPHRINRAPPPYHRHPHRQENTLDILVNSNKATQVSSKLIQQHATSTSSDSCKKTPNLCCHPTTQTQAACSQPGSDIWEPAAIVFDCEGSQTSPPGWQRARHSLSRSCSRAAPSPPTRLQKRAFSSS